MRVLDPKVTDPIQKLYHKGHETIGDAGTLATIAGVGVLAPVGAGVMVDSLFALASSIGWYGFLRFRAYKKNTKEKKRLTQMTRYRKQIPADYHDIADKLISEVFNCGEYHFEFEMGEQGVENVYHYRQDSFGLEFSRKTRRFTESSVGWEKRQAKEAILVAGHGCEYCGKRVDALRQLKDECQVQKIDNDDSVQAALSVVESKKMVSGLAHTMSQIESDVMRELKR